MTDEPVTILTLVAPLSQAALEEVHNLVAQLFDTVGVTEMLDRIRFETAVIEVAGNILEHSTRTDPPSDEPRSFNIVLQGDAHALTAEFRDDGKPVEIDFEQISMPADDAEEGRGLALALATVDEISHEHTDGLNIWRLTCRRSP
ncbi:ATP-binding protein [Aeromicrobium sp.]|uniref:ATP-binding protein n=1 Tax=Aeromicrobium sp. TaxID=1871063 RepID=UPI0019A7E19A|nr:ATP-binding protein [Aeromicrobium sp.]MBC7630991.1 ATP-binding protein [Aeromicrobium sp.]